MRRKRLDIPGSCTEGQISHVLSERFSRDPMGWSEECLGKLSQARVYLKNGGTLTREDFKEKDEKLNGKEKYREYAQRMMKEAGEGCFDWSIFEKPIGLSFFEAACYTIENSVTRCFFSAGGRS